MFDALLSESSANRCSWVVCAAAISGFGLKAGIWACRHVPPRPITPPRTVRREQLRTKTGQHGLKPVRIADPTTI